MFHISSYLISSDRKNASGDGSSRDFSSLTFSVKDVILLIFLVVTILLSWGVIDTKLSVQANELRRLAIDHKTNQQLIITLQHRVLIDENKIDSLKIRTSVLEDHEKVNHN